jgi:hypothetical protein
VKSGEGEASLESSGRAFQCKRAKSKALAEPMQSEEGHDISCPYIGRLRKTAGGGSGSGEVPQSETRNQKMEIGKRRGEKREH